MEKSREERRRNLATGREGRSDWGNWGLGFLREKRRD